MGRKIRGDGGKEREDNKKSRRNCMPGGVGKKEMEPGRDRRMFTEDNEIFKSDSSSKD